MTHTYHIKGMSCTSCENTVSENLKKLTNVSMVEVSLTTQTLRVSMKNHLSTEQLQHALGNKYQIFDSPDPAIDNPNTLKHNFNWKDIEIWKKSGFNTFNCLVGCSIGDFGMIIFLQFYYPQTPLGIQMALAIIAGLLTSITLETFLLHFREKLIWKLAFKTAIGMSFLSMVAMEIAMNITDFMITGGGKLGFSDPNYWLAFIPAAVIGFLVPLPYNYYQLKKHNKTCH